MRVFTITLLAALAAMAAAAEEKPIELKKAIGVEAVEGDCGACHSLDYVQMNSSFLSPAAWEAEVTKMIKAFGAPISDADAAIIVDYLKKNYGGA